jgi:hypothetical protein
MHSKVRPDASEFTGKTVDLSARLGNNEDLDNVSNVIFFAIEAKIEISYIVDI